MKLNEDSAWLVVSYKASKRYTLCRAVFVVYGNYHTKQVAK